MHEYTVSMVEAAREMQTAANKLLREATRLQRNARRANTWAAKRENASRAAYLRELGRQCREQGCAYSTAGLAL